MNTTIKKVKYDRKNGTVTIEYSLKNLDNGDEISASLKSNDRPLPEFVQQLDALSHHVEAICELPQGYCHAAEIRGVSYSWTNEIMGAVITALIPVESANGPVVINTPHLPSEQYSEGGKSPTLSNTCIKILESLLQEAQRYIKGERTPDNQTQMVFEEPQN